MEDYPTDENIQNDPILAMFRVRQRKRDREKKIYIELG